MAVDISQVTDGGIRILATYGIDDAAIAADSDNSDGENDDTCVASDEEILVSVPEERLERQSEEIAELKAVVAALEQQVNGLRLELDKEGGMDVEQVAKATVAED